MHVARRVLHVDGIRTTYLEAGDGPPLVLLHGGAPGDCAEASFERNVAPLAAAHRVVAPDWTGYGGTDKVRDFADPLGRMVAHMARFLALLELSDAAMVGLSMGGTLLIRDLASAEPRLSPRAVVLVSGGGFSPDNEARRTVQSYDGSLEHMRRIIATVLHDDGFAADEQFVRDRHEWSLVLGAWEFAASLGLRRPEAAGGAAPFGAADETAYERVDVPVLITAGAHDPLREDGWAAELAGRLPDARASVYEHSGHLPNLEEAPRWNVEVARFLADLA